MALKVVKHWLIALALLAAFPPDGAARAQGIHVIPVPAEKASVYDENRNGEADLEGDTWVFDQNDDGRADLVIAFRSEGSGVAFVYDDADADGQVSYSADADGVQVLEPHWRVKVERRGADWYLPNGQPDWNLDLTVDSGFELADVDVVFALSDARATELWGTTAIDGAPDVSIRYWDINADGIPDYEYNSVNLAGRFDALIVNRLSEWHVEPVYRFPPLGLILQMDWSRARIVKIQHLIHTRLTEAGYFFYFNRPTAPGEISFGLENPFAFYDLQGDRDGVPELTLRAVTEDHDRLRENLTVVNEIRYSWAQSGDVAQYRLYLVGNALNANVVSYPTHSISHVAYEDLPAFALGHAWMGAAFAEFEAETPRAFPEGIYENLFFSPLLRDQLLSQRPVSLPRYLPVYRQLREEYNFENYHGQPQLYFSPLDRRLHLVGARAGLIIYEADTTGVSASGFDFTDHELTSGELAIRDGVTYADTDDDGYVDTWTTIGDRQPSAQLTLRAGMLIYATQDGVALKRLSAGLGVALWEAAPPATPDEWRAYQERLERDAANRRPLRDLAGLFADVPGDVIRLEGATLESISTQPRMLIAYVTTSGMTLPAEVFTALPQPVPAGDYVLWERDSELWLDSPTPPEIQISSVTFMPVEDVDVNTPSGYLDITMQNTGLSDAHVLGVVAEDVDSGLTARLDHPALIPAQGTHTLRWPWYPTSTGARPIGITVRYEADANGEPVVIRQTFDMGARGRPSAPAPLYFSDMQRYGLVLIAALLALMMFVAVLMLAHAQESMDDAAG